MKFVVDASVVVKWFVEEEGQPEALAILERGDECFAPDHMLVEVAGAFDKKLKAGAVTREQVVEAIAAVQAKMALVAGTRLIEAALDLASELGHPLADCLYLACAIELDACVVSADKLFIEKAHARGYRSRASLLGFETATSSDEPKISPADLNRIKKLHGRVQVVFDHVLAFVRPPKAQPLAGIVSVQDLAPAFASPDYRRLVQLIEDLSPDERADLIALCWLGRSYNHDSWASLREQARSLEDGNSHAAYIISKLHNLQRGIACLEREVRSVEG